MERAKEIIMNFEQAKIIMGKNFIGPDELKKVSGRLGIISPDKLGRIPTVPYGEKELKKYAKAYVMILGIPSSLAGDKLTLNSMRNFFGVEPIKKEPCFYNQDWYLKEKFAAETSLKFKWYLIRKAVDKKTRGQNPELMKRAAFPSAILTAFTFFAYYHINGQILWRQDFIWCSDKDHNGDRIYTGRYIDPNNINKNGFNIHRHLSISPGYGVAAVINR